MTSQTIEQWLREFASQHQAFGFTFDDEYGLQESLICYLRQQLQANGYSDYTVDREVKLSFAINGGPLSTKCKKSKIDVVIFKGLCIKQTKEKYAIELKFLHNNQIPVQMYKCIQDIAFMEEAQDLWHTGIQNPFNGSFCLTFADDPIFYRKPSNGGSKAPIYSYFRNPNIQKIPQAPKSISLPVKLSKSTKNKQNLPQNLNVIGNYTIQWQPTSINQRMKYYLITI